ncbi:hypothetical protein [Kaistella pullorum]|uniref:Uncharacterized protein n=1 Tax=Kaistella pullorum TaxID=2763074 RepID=A0ABR8WPQ3_9FLAO|nr:hypothetical protein [Kaistella pullorum]MBD8019066.1 hypothetical protein [Kaistella pullorum]
MIKKFILSLVFMIPLLMHSQNISLDKLIDLRSKSSSEIVAFMDGRNWKTIENESNDEGSLQSQKIVFAYDFNEQTDTASSFIIFALFPDLKQAQTIEIQITDKSIFQIFLDRIKEFNPTFSNFFFDRNHTKTVLQTEDNTFVLNYIDGLYYISIMETPMYNQIMIN